MQSWGSYWLNIFAYKCCNRKGENQLNVPSFAIEFNFNTLEIRKSLSTLLFCLSRAASIQRYTSRRVPCTCQSSHANRRSTAPFTRYEAHACSFGGWECRSPPLRGRRREMRSDTGSGFNYQPGYMGLARWIYILKTIYTEFWGKMNSFE